MSIVLQSLDFSMLNDEKIYTRAEISELTKIKYTKLGYFFTYVPVKVDNKIWRVEFYKDNDLKKALRDLKERFKNIN